MPARGYIIFLKYTTTGHGGDGVGFLLFGRMIFIWYTNTGRRGDVVGFFCLKDIYLVHDRRARR